MSKDVALRVAYVVWRDAAAIEAAAEDTPIDTGLATLHEVGFFLAETSDVVTIGMEGEGDCKPGRWRLNIPKAMILEMHLAPVSALVKRGARKK